MFYYTIGQRKWLDIWGLKEPVFVIKKDLENNLLVVWTDKDVNLYSDSLIIKNVNFLSWSLIFPFDGKAKIRYRQQDQECKISFLKNGKYETKFLQPQKAVASGQIVAIYNENDYLVMSWIIN